MSQWIRAGADGHFWKTETDGQKQTGPWWETCSFPHSFVQEPLTQGVTLGRDIQKGENYFQPLNVEPQRQGQLKKKVAL